MAEAPKYRLIYFNGRGRAEVIRWIFEVAGVTYEDFRLPREQWVETKLTMPFGQLPLLEVDGVQIAQTAAICRYLATQFGLGASGPLQKAHADMIVDAVNDMWTPFSAIIRQTLVPESLRNQQNINEMAAIFSNETMPLYLSYFERFLKLYANGDEFFIQDKMTWVDMYFTSFLSNIMMVGKEVLGLDITIDQYSHLKAVMTRVKEHPKIADWIKRRPITLR